MHQSLGETFCRQRLTAAIIQHDLAGAGLNQRSQVTRQTIEMGIEIAVVEKMQFSRFQ
jgi:hypothetical protein